jgi:hypothetical protein
MALALKASMTDRRKVLMLLLYGAATLAVAASAHAGQGDDGGHDDGGGGNSGSGNSGSGNSSGGGKGNGGTGGNSGAGGSRGNNRDLTSPSGASASKVSGSSANGDDDEDEDDDARIKDWVKKGEAAPLSEVLKTVRENYNGKVVNVKLVGKDKPVVYKIRIIDQKNNLIEVQVDARKATIVGSAAAGIY